MVVVMGVSGSGKTTVGRSLASRLGVDHGDADDFHPAGNVAKMAAGQPLVDADREPWLRAVGAWLASHGGDGGAVASCSALKRSYRDVLRAAAPGVTFLHLQGGRGLLAERLSARSGHFMPPSLLASQLRTLEPLEPDEAGMAVDAGRPVVEIVDEFLGWWHARRA